MSLLLVTPRTTTRGWAQSPLPNPKTCTQTNSPSLAALSQHGRTEPRSLICCLVINGGPALPPASPLPGWGSCHRTRRGGAAPAPRCALISALVPARIPAHRVLSTALACSLPLRGRITGWQHPRLDMASVHRRGLGRTPPPPHEVPLQPPRVCMFLGTCVWIGEGGHVQRH